MMRPYLIGYLGGYDWERLTPSYKQFLKGPAKRRTRKKRRTSRKEEDQQKRGGPAERALPSGSDARNRALFVAKEVDLKNRSQEVDNVYKGKGQRIAKNAELLCFIFAVLIEC